MAKNKGNRPVAKAADPSTAKSPDRRRTLILTGRGKLVRGWINQDGTVSR